MMVFPFGGYPRVFDGASWSSLPTTNFPAFLGERAVAAYDPSHDQVVEFGGDYDAQDLRPYPVHVWSNDVSVLPLSGSPTWTQLTTTGARPTARSYATMIYDPAGNRMILFGGFGNTLADFNDAWALNLSDAIWVQLAPTGQAPPPRDGHVAFYDPVHDAMIVYGGKNSGGKLSDVWRLSLANPPAWTQLQPVGAALPALYGPTAIYDPATSRMVVVSGSTELLSLKSDPPLCITMHPGGTSPEPYPFPRRLSTRARRPRSAQTTLWAASFARSRPPDATRPWAP
jgi:hypothetical protein